MKLKFLASAAILALLAACATDNFGPVPESTRTGVGPTDAELVGDKASTDNVLTYGMGYDQNRYSPLRQINRDNVRKLTPIWTAGPPFSDSVIPLKRSVGGRGPNLQHQMSPLRRPGHVLLRVHRPVRLNGTENRHKGDCFIIAAPRVTNRPQCGAFT